MASIRLTDRGVGAIRATGTQRIELWDSELRGLYLRISSSSKVWGYRYRRLDGTQPRVRLGRYVPPDQADGDKSALTVAGARAKARRLQSQVDDGRDPATERQTAKVEARAEPIRTIDDMAEAYFKACETGEYRPSKKRKRPPTIAQERYLYNKYLKSLGRLRVEALTRKAAQQVLRDLLEAGRGVTSNRVRSLLRQIYAWGMLEGRVAINPAGEIDDMAEEKPRERVLTDDETRRLWNALIDPSKLRRPLPNGKDEPLMVGRPVRIAIQLAMLTLQRRGEIATMNEDELDFDEKLWVIPAAKTKAGRSTAVPLGDEAIALIREALALRSQSLDDEHRKFVFVGRGSAQASIDPAAISHAMRDIRAAIGVPDITTHDLRRSGATRLAKAGISPFIISKLLNHAGNLGGGAAITMAVYVQHDFLDEKREAMLTFERSLMDTVMSDQA